MFGFFRHCLHLASELRIFELKGCVISRNLKTVLTVALDRLRFEIFLHPALVATPTAAHQPGELLKSVNPACQTTKDTLYCEEMRDYHATSPVRQHCSSVAAASERVSKRCIDLGRRFTLKSARALPSERVSATVGEEGRESG